MTTYIKKFNNICIKDIAEVGGKNASLGEMFTHLSSKGINIPNGFAITAFAFQHFISYNKMDGLHEKILTQLERPGYSNLSTIGHKLRELILTARMPDDLADAIIASYQHITENDAKEVAVRSSATAEDLPEASFAGQHVAFRMETISSFFNYNHCYSFN